MLVFTCTWLNQCDSRRRRNKFKVKGSNFTCLSICRVVCSRYSVWLIFWRLKKHLVIRWPIGILSGLSLGYELLSGTSVAKVDWLGAMNKCVRHIHYENLLIDKRSRYNQMAANCIINFPCVKKSASFPVWKHNLSFPIVISSHLVFFMSILVGYLKRNTVSHRQQYINLASWKKLEYKEPSYDYIAYVDVIWN